MLAKTPVHQCCLPVSGYPSVRTCPTARPRISEYTRVRQGTTAKKKGGSLVRGTQESDRVASLTPAETEVRGGAVLPGSGGSEHQAAGAVPQPIDKTSGGIDRLGEVSEDRSIDR